MKRKNSLIKLFLVLLTVALLASLQLAGTEFDKNKRMDTHISVNEAALELKFFVYTQEEWEDFFAEYKEEYITRGMVSDLLKKVGISDVISFEEAGKQDAVSREEWNQVYAQLLDYLDIEHQIKETDVLVLESTGNGEAYSLYTNEGTYRTLLPDTFFEEWESYTIYLLGEECIGIKSALEAEMTVSNAYIISAAKRMLSFLFDGRYYEKKVNLKEGMVREGIADIKVSDSKVVAIGQKQDYIEGNLLSYDDTTIEIEGYGRISHGKRLPVYRAVNTVEELSVSDIILGNMDVKYIIGENEVCAILITAPAEISYVRVLLLASDGGKFRSEVYLSCDGEVSIACGETHAVVPAGTTVAVKEFLTGDAETLIVNPSSEGSLLYICNENGEKISNGYSGKMEVRQYSGGYCVVNEVDLETYLYSVVPSEMPSNYQPEALKAQAVCARSYAYIQVMRADLAEYGAHIDDSTSYQVYNNVAKTDASVKAVDETAGKVMLYNGDVIEAYYFSTSVGYTDTIEVWNVLDDTEYGYLAPACLNYTEYNGDLSDESAFKAYLLSDMSGYESDMKYYRWTIEADYSDKTDAVKEILNTRRASVARHITYYKNDGVTEVDSMKGFGTLESVRVSERSNSGSILSLMLYFENGCAKVQSEYNIRKILGCGASAITYLDGSKGDKISLIPSAFCTVEKQSDGSYLLCGGGYGHGLGMSQNGANGLAKAGYSYVDILNYFYNEIEVVDIQL